MSKHHFPYTLHDYLDRELAAYNGEAPEYLIREKKAEYKRIYAKWYREMYRSLHEQVTVQFTQPEFTKLKAQSKELGIRIAAFIKRQLKNPDTGFDRMKVKIQLMQLTDVIEECTFEKDLVRLSECLAIIESLKNELV